MNFLKNLTALLPAGKKEEKLEYFFAINIGTEIISAALWSIAGKQLKILDTASQNYSPHDEIINVTDRLLDQVLGLKEIEPQKILFGVPNHWLVDDNLKDEYLRILRSLVKELELAPMAYVATSNALIHFLEKQEGVPITAILVDFEKSHLTVTVVRAGKLDGVKIITRGESSGADIEKALLTFTEVETLPSKILIYGLEADKLKSQLLSFSWMSKLSFLHFPKIDVLDKDISIRSVCLAGGSEINENIEFNKTSVQESPVKSTPTAISDEKEGVVDDTNFGFVVGDVAERNETKANNINEPEITEDKELVAPEEESFEVDNFEREIAPPEIPAPPEQKRQFNFQRLIPKNFAVLSLIVGIIGVVVLAAGAYLFLVKADVKVFVEPKVLEKDAQVIADPAQKTVDEGNKIIPGQIVEVEVSGSAKDTATGQKQIGDPAKGTIIIRNKTDNAITVSKGTSLASSNGLKFNLDLSVTVASKSGDEGTYGKATATATALSIGADGNLPSGSDFSVAGYSADKLIAKSEGNFSGGTSKDVTVVSSDDQQKLLAKLSSDLRSSSQQKLQDKYPNKKILQEALSEQIISKSFNKNINDQASEFSLNMTVRNKGTAFDDADLRTIVSKLVNTQVPDGFQLDLTATETQADVSELKKDGKLVFLARFKAKLLPKIDTDKIKNQIKLKTPEQVINLLKGMDNILGAEVKMTPSLPSILQRLPILQKNITVEVGLK